MTSVTRGLMLFSQTDPQVQNGPKDPFCTKKIVLNATEHEQQKPAAAHTHYVFCFCAPAVGFLCEITQA